MQKAKPGNVFRSPIGEVEVEAESRDEAPGFREPSVADSEQMQQWLITEVFPQEHQDERLRDMRNKLHLWKREEYRDDSPSSS